MTATSTSASPQGTFVTVPGDRHSEVARTLAEPVPQALSALDQLGLWGNLGVSLLGFTGAIFVLQPGGPGTPELSLAAGLTAIVLGTVLGTLPVALAGLPGTRTGAPAMVLLRGLFGARLSYLPTALNILQCLGWAVFELVTIATAAHTVAPALPRWGYILIAGVATALLAVRPLGAIRILRRYVTSAVVIRTAARLRGRGPFLATDDRQRLQLLAQRHIACHPTVGSAQVAVAKGQCRCEVVHRLQELSTPVVIGKLHRIDRDTGSLGASGKLGADRAGDVPARARRQLQRDRAGIAPTMRQTVHRAVPGQRGHGPCAGT